MKSKLPNCKYLASWVFGVLSFGAIVFGFSNCSRATLGLGSTAASQSNAATSINVGSTTCATGQVAIGVDSSQNVICATVQTVAASTTCPADESVYETVPASGAILCVDNTSWDQVGSVCPVGEYLSAYTSAGAIQCASPTASSTTAGSTVTLTCPSGQYVSGITNNQPVCTALPTSVPSAVVCSAGQYLFDLNGSTPDCRTPAWRGGIQQSCPSGSFALGWVGTQLLCQQNTFSLGQTSQCPTGQVLLSYSSSGTGSCSAPPNPDISHACPAGYNVNGVNNNQIICQSGGAAGGPQCPAGQFVVGLNNGQVICATASTAHYTGTCPASSYPIGVSNGALVCSGLASVLSIGSNNTCSPGNSNVCSINGGLGLQTCDASGQMQSACQAVSCNSGYQLSNGSCSAVSCVAGSAQTCQMSNGVGTQYCGTMGTWGSCQVQACSAGYGMSGGQCVQALCSPGSLAACSLGSAYGFQSCNVSGNGYGACVYTSCQNGYSLQGQSCVDTTPPRITFTAVPVNPTVGNSASLTFAAIDNESGVSKISCELDGNPYQPCASPVQLAGLANGTHVFKVTATDVTGNTSARSSVWTSEVCVSGPYEQCTYGNGSGTQMCQTDGSYAPACLLNSCSTGYQLLNGACVALNCGVGYSVSGNQCIDNTPPVLLIAVKPLDPTIGTTAMLQFAAADYGSGVAGFHCQLDSALAYTCTSPLNLNGLTVGAHTLTVTAVDAAGNATSQSANWHQYGCSPGTIMSCGTNNGQGQETCSASGSGYGTCTAKTCNNGYSVSMGMCLDVTAPTITFLSGPQSASTNSNATFSFSVADSGSGVKSITCSLDGAAPVACQNPVNFAGLKPGSHSLTIVAVDSSGNSVKSVKTWSVQSCAPSSVNVCSVANGQGQMTCSADGMSQGSCVAVSCAAGFSANGSSCAAIPRTPIWRFYNPTSQEHFMTASELEGLTNPAFHLEGIGFSVYAVFHPGMHAVYRCYEQSGWHFMSDDASCEGFHHTVNEGSYGYMYNAPAAGLVPVYRFMSPCPYPAAGDHLETVNPGGENLAPNGYRLEGILGYVPAY